VSTLYAAIDLPADWARDQAPSAAPARLPALESLAARGDSGPAPADWRRWALERAGLAAPAGDLPLGRMLAAAQGLAPRPEDTWLLATPLTLRAGLSDVAIAARGTPLDRDGRAALAAQFNADWQGTPWRLHAADPDWLLSHAGSLEVETNDPAALLGRAPQPPRGAGAPALRRLSSELEMWLHAAPAAGCNALWLWGAGRAPLAGTPRWPALEGVDPALAAARALHPGAAADARLVRWSLADAHTDAGADADPLAAAEQRWFRPLARALARGELARAELHVPGMTVVLGRVQRLRLWRRARPWWELAA